MKDAKIGIILSLVGVRRAYILRFVVMLSIMTQYSMHKKGRDRCVLVHIRLSAAHIKAIAAFIFIFINLRLLLRSCLTPNPFACSFGVVLFSCSLFMRYISSLCACEALSMINIGTLYDYVQSFTSTNERSICKVSVIKSLMR